MKLIVERKVSVWKRTIIDGPVKNAVIAAFSGKGQSEYLTETEEPLSLEGETTMLVYNPETGETLFDNGFPGDR